MTFGSTVAAGNVNSLDALNSRYCRCWHWRHGVIGRQRVDRFTSTNDTASQAITVTTAPRTPLRQRHRTFTLDDRCRRPAVAAARRCCFSDHPFQPGRPVQQHHHADHTTSQDASFNGINLLNGDDLKLTFNETGKSTLTLKGVTFNAAGLGVGALTSGTDFLDSASANRALPNSALRAPRSASQASALGSNLSIVQVRQDFSRT